MRNLPFGLLTLMLTIQPACHREKAATSGNQEDDMGRSNPLCVDPGACDSPDMKSVPDFSNSGPDLAGPVTPSCQQQAYPLGVTQAAPNIHVVIDRSGSMSFNAAGAVPIGAETAKWEDLSASLTQIFTAYGNKANQWGMSMFPTENTYHSCVAGDIAVPLAAPSVSIPDIQSRLAAYTRSNLVTYNGYTPTTEALQGVLNQVPLNDTNRNNYVVLMTDGLPKCVGGAPQDVTPVIAALYAKNPHVRTFVIGFGSELVPDPVASQATNPALLNDWAVAGHTERAGTTKYYQASDAAALNAAFTDIVTGIASCTFTVTGAPADPLLVVGTIGGAPISRDLVNGYSYDAGTHSVTFHGASCQQIQDHPTTTPVGVVYGCPAP